MSLTPPVLPPQMTRAQWDALPDHEQLSWINFCTDVGWLMQQPQFRKVAFVFLDDPRFCGAYRSTFHLDPREEGNRQGRRDAGLEMERHLQTISPRMFVKMLHEQMNARRDAPQESNDG